MSRLVEPIDFGKLLTQGTEFQIDPNDVKHHESDSEEDLFGLESDMAATDITDERSYLGDVEFKELAKSMESITADGKIKKKILLEGTGEKPGQFNSVKIHYSSFLELESVPFDCTHLRNKPRQFIIGKGEVLPGLELGVGSMKLHEKCQLLVHPDYAFRGSHCISRVPANSYLLFDVELLEIVNISAAITFEQLPEEKQAQFEDVYKLCQALNEQGKQYFKAHDLKKAIVEYNKAITKLEKILVPSDQVENRRDLLIKLYSNLLVCQTRNRDSIKGCTTAKKMYALTQDGELLKMPIKIFYNHAKCLRILGEYDEAKIFLNKALKAEPKNREILNELMALECDIAKYRKSKQKLANALVGNTD